MKCQKPWAQLFRIAVFTAALAGSGCNLVNVVPDKPPGPLPSPVVLAYPSKDPGKFEVFMVDVDKGSILKSWTTGIDFANGARICDGGTCAQLALLLNLYKTTDPIVTGGSSPGVPPPPPPEVLIQLAQRVARAAQM